MNQLRARVIGILLAAALPAIVLVAILAYQAYDRAREASVEALVRDAEMLESRFDAIPPGAARNAWLIAVSAAWDADLARNCESRLREIKSNSPAFAGFVLFRDNALVCAVGFPDAASRARTIEQIGLGGMQPGQSRDGVLRGAGAEAPPIVFGAARAPSTAANIVALVTVDPDFMTKSLDVFQSAPSSVAHLIDETGGAISSATRGPSLIHDLVRPPLANAPRTLSASDATGAAYVITIRKLTSPGIWLVTHQREADVLEDARRQLILAVAAPILTLLLVGLAVWLGLRRFVLQWIQSLTRVTNAYAGGDLNARVGDASAAPAEIAQLAQRFDALADRVAERTVELEGEVSQKRRYIRELHHRVKNNLQVIASLLALQKRNLPQEQRSILRFPEDRVNAMAAAYGVSYAQTETGHVGVLAVVREVVTRLQSGVEAGYPHIRVTIAGEDAQIDLDMAIAIAMLLAELLPAIFNRSIGGAFATSVDATLAPGRLVIRVAGPAPDESDASILSDRFARAYLRQLDATLDADKPGRLTLVIPMRQAEELARQATA